MTREEAIRILHCPNAVGGRYSKKYGQALDIAIKALEQEHCEDAVSREVVKEALRNRTGESISDCINAVPPVTPARKEWIPVSERLPEEDTDVLITNGIGIYVGWIDVDRNKWLTDHNTMDSIVAWMPLPQPYKADMRGAENEEN